MKNGNYSNNPVTLNKVILYILRHIIIFLGICYTLILILGILYGTTLNPVTLTKGAFLTLFDSTFGNGIIFIGGFFYLILAALYELSTDSFKYFNTKKSTYIIKIIFSLLVGIGGLVYLLWITKFIQL